MTEKLEHMDASKINFLEDSPQPLSERDELSHKSLANRIVQAIRGCPTPYTIGLSGEWGSGKTSVAHYIREELKKEKDTSATIPVVYFDAWKYQRDSLRRQFLIEAHRQLKEAGFLNSADLTDAELYETRTLQHSPEIDWKSVLPWKSDHWVASWFRIIIFLAGLAGLVFALIASSSMATRLVAALLGGTGVSAFLTLLPKLFVTGTPTDVKPPLTSAEEFGSKFLRWLNQNKLKGRRMLVIVDNVDRCDDAQIIELLGDIKTFLEPPDSKVIFLLPVDEGAIRRVLTQRYGTMDTANEFLRKFFNTLFRIPVPLAGETRSFAATKLRQTGLMTASGATEEELGKVITVMTAAYPNNPRRVIQFLNRLSSQWLILASTAEQLRRPAVVADLGAIAKGVAIRERWPDLASFLENSPLELAKIERQAIGGTEAFALGPTGITTEEVESGQLLGLAAFVRATQTISLGRPRLTLTGKADRFELELPDAELLRAYLRGEQQDTLGELIGDEAWAEASEAGNVSAFIKQELDDLWSAQQFEGVGILLSVVGPGLESIPEQFRRALADTMADRLDRSAVTDALAKVRPAAVIPIADNSHDSKEKALAAIPQVLTQTEATRRPDFAKELAANSETLASAKDAILNQGAVKDDLVVLNSLVLTDDKPNAFWSATVVLNACAQVVASTDQATLARTVDPTKSLLSAAAEAGEDVHDHVIKLLANETAQNTEENFRWAARSEVVLTPRTGTKIDPEPIRARAEATRDKGGIFTKIDYMALITRLRQVSDAASSAPIDSELSAWLGSVPLDPNTELGDWFPNLAPSGLDIPTLLLSTPSSPSESELQVRVQFVRQQSIGWARIAEEIVKLLAVPETTGKAVGITLQSIHQNREAVPSDFFPEVWSSILNQLYDGSTYRPQMLPLLQQFTQPQNDDEEDSARERRRSLRQKLIDAMAAGQTRATTDYQNLHFPKPETDQDIDQGLARIKARQFTSSSSPFLAFIVEKPPMKVRSELVKELEILATDATHWELGLDALSLIAWPPGAQNAARVATSLATDGMVQRQSNPQRARKALDTALHMAAFAKERSPRQDIERTIDALRRSEVISVDDEKVLKDRLNATHS